jgi:hypothetical protein
VSLPLFAPAPADGAFRQGEILSGVVQIHLSLECLRGQSEENSFEEKLHPHAIIVSQECDLDWDFKARKNGLGANALQLKQVPNVLLCELIPADTLRGDLKGAGGGLAGSDFWRSLKGNREERYHFFESVAPLYDFFGEGLPELVADFKRVFTVPTEELYLRVGRDTRRRSVMQPPYLQNFNVRIGFYSMRVALPDPADLKMIAPPGSP